MDVLTSNREVDNMADMPTPTSWNIDFEPSTVLALGIRAAWLHLQMTGPAADALAPRDRELLTLVATRPTGLPESALVDLQRRLGVQPGASVRWLDRLIAQGWIERHLEDDEPRIDLPAPDLDWITHHVNRLTPGRTS
jgi:hypothetical protein